MFVIMADKENHREMYDITKLVEKNFPLWIFEVAFDMEAKDLTVFTSGTDVEPIKTKDGALTLEWKNWQTKNQERYFCCHDGKVPPCRPYKLQRPKDNLG